jgi:hypothetical protein
VDFEMSSTWVVFGIEIGLAFIGCLLALVAWEFCKKIIRPTNDGETKHE